MAAKWEKLEGNVGVLTIEVDAKEVNNSIDAVQKSSKNNQRTRFP